MNPKIALIWCIVVITITSTAHALEQEHQDLKSGKNNDEILQLPLPGEASSSQSLHLGEKLALDHLGPIIINKDGTMRRITNWSGLTADEKKHTLRKVAQRNQKRLGVLKNAERLEIIRRYYEEQEVTASSIKTTAEDENKPPQEEQVDDMINNAFSTSQGDFTQAEEEDVVPTALGSHENMDNGEL